ncbi:MAG: phage tail tape measure protein [Hyphomicrobiales bacterium]
MTQDDDGLEVAIGLDASAFKSELEQLRKLGDSFGHSLAKSLATVVTGGAKLSDVMRSLLSTLSDKALSAALDLLGEKLGGLFSGLFAGLIPGAKGNVISNGVLKPFAEGGIVAKPTLFAMKGGNIGLMGEAGPEAILPLARGHDGRLGVNMHGETRPVTLNFNIHTRDAESFSRSQSQLAAMIGRAVDRGMRNL